MKRQHSFTFCPGAETDLLFCTVGPEESQQGMCLRFGYAARNVPPLPRSTPRRPKPSPTSDKTGRPEGRKTHTANANARPSQCYEINSGRPAPHAGHSPISFKKQAVPVPCPRPQASLPRSRQQPKVPAPQPLGMRRGAQRQAEKGPRMFERSEFARTPPGASTAGCPQRSAAQGRSTRGRLSLVPFFGEAKKGTRPRGRIPASGPKTGSAAPTSSGT